MLFDSTFVAEKRGDQIRCQSSHFPLISIISNAQVRLGREEQAIGNEVNEIAEQRSNHNHGNCG